MKPGFKTSILGLCLCLVFSAVCHAQIYTLGPNLVENGDFGELNGWTIHGYAWYPYSGGATGGSYINYQGFAYQDIATQPGSEYLFQFWTASTNPIAHVFWGSQDLGYFPTTSGLLSWEENQVEVTAVSATTRLYFTEDNIPLGVNLDNVAVYLIPEPDSATLAASGFLLFLIFRFRRRTSQAFGRGGSGGLKR